ncbi:MAG: hypothetical protein HY701_12720 [Gemmatimonadetes bacterium]|nr:hypothetical protein [Gemmatimonadota bacterium]
MTLLGTILSAGIWIGTLTTEVKAQGGRIENQAGEIRLLRNEISALNQYLIAHARE